MSTRDEVIDVVVGEHRIAATLVTPATQMPAVMFLHGWGGSQEQYVARARQIAALGCICLTVDLRGHAKTLASRDSVSREENLQDVVAAYDVLKAHPHSNGDAICVVGSSYGGYLGAILTTLRPVRWLALRAPALYKDSDWTTPKSMLRTVQNLEAYRTSKVAFATNRALAACAAFRGDVLLVESGEDAIIPHAVIESYREAFRNAKSLTYRVIEKADHALTDPSCREAYTAVLVNWITEMVAGVRAPDAEGQRLIRQGMKAQATSAEPGSNA
jgi:pimeloyl-ACP methyl ester carboxylesterase